MSNVLHTELQQKLSQASLRISGWLGGEGGEKSTASVFEQLPVIKPGAGLDLSTESSKIGDFTSGKSGRKANPAQRNQSRSLQALENRLRNENRTKARRKVEKPRKETKKTSVAAAIDSDSEDELESYDRLSPLGGSSCFSWEWDSALRRSEMEELRPTVDWPDWEFMAKARLELGPAMEEPTEVRLKIELEPTVDAEEMELRL
ncbi:hypothetical protein OGAPHI_003022 [Ogataea philodendri]|uniref:Uncharacterized protein n=1 Tax=Ogataea philodendri TaxID=1378263 RepID=A0A9P8P7U8_9ASCO|nr:uncharacterized protein OGAPHI_003022 [Ogataea philodendri]KAH3667373.1 hypothetical protein OGAPHI_003022 [Ogataea philodendri]